MHFGTKSYLKSNRNHTAKQKVRSSLINNESGNLRDQTKIDTSLTFE